MSDSDESGDSVSENSGRERCLDSQSQSETYGENPARDETPVPLVIITDSESEEENQTNSGISPVWYPELMSGESDEDSPSNIDTSNVNQNQGLDLEEEAIQKAPSPTPPKTSESQGEGSQEGLVSEPEEPLQPLGKPETLPQERKTTPTPPAAVQILTDPKLYQLLESIDRRLNHHTTLHESSMGHVKTLVDSLDDCRKRLVALETLCVPARRCSHEYEGGNLAGLTPVRGVKRTCPMQAAAVTPLVRNQSSSEDNVQGRGLGPVYQINDTMVPPTNGPVERPEIPMNNQLAPGSRANNFRDNFHGQSRQNMLSNPKNNTTQNSALPLNVTTTNDLDNSHQVEENPGSVSRYPGMCEGTPPSRSERGAIFGSDFAKSVGSEIRNLSQSLSEFHDAYQQESCRDPEVRSRSPTNGTPYADSESSDGYPFEQDKIRLPLRETPKSSTRLYSAGIPGTPEENPERAAWLMQMNHPVPVELFPDPVATSTPVKPPGSSAARTDCPMSPTGTDIVGFRSPTRPSVEMPLSIPCGQTVKLSPDSAEQSPSSPEGTLFLEPEPEPPKRPSPRMTRLKARLATRSCREPSPTNTLVLTHLPPSQDRGRKQPVRKAPRAPSPTGTDIVTYRDQVKVKEERAGSLSVPAESCQPPESTEGTSESHGQSPPVVSPKKKKKSKKLSSSDIIDDEDADARRLLVGGSSDSDSGSDSEDEILKKVDAQLKKNKKVEERKGDGDVVDGESPETPSTRTKRKAGMTKEEIQELRKCPKLTQKPAVEVDRMSDSILDRIKKNNGRVTLQVATTKSSSSLKGFNLIVKPRNYGPSGKPGPLSKRSKPAADKANKETLNNPLVSDEDEVDGSADSIPLGLDFDTIVYNSNMDIEEEYARIRLDPAMHANSSDSDFDLSGPPGAGATEGDDGTEDSARNALVGGPSTKKGDSKKNKEEAGIDKPKKKKGEQIITPRVIGLTSSSNEDGSDTESKKKKKKNSKREKETNGKEAGENNDSDGSDFLLTPKSGKPPKPDYLKDIPAGAKKKSKGKKERKKADNESSSDDSCLATTKRKKQEAQMRDLFGDDDSGSTSRSTRSKSQKNRPTKPPVVVDIESSDSEEKSDVTDEGDRTITPGKQKPPVSDASDESDFDRTIMPGKQKRPVSDASDDSDFVPKLKKKILIRKNILDSDSDTPMKIESSSSELLSLDESDDTKKLRPNRKKKRIRSGTSDESGDSKHKKKTKKSRTRRRIIIDDPNSGSDTEHVGYVGSHSDSDIEILPTSSSPAKGRKNIRKVMGDKEVEKTTRQAAKEEEERKRRVAEKQKLFNQDFTVQAESETTRLKTLVLDFDKDTKAPILSVDPSIVCQLKPHQAKGIQFMWNTCFESISNPVTGGCILAHCMGLGKTLQTIAFLHAVMSNKVLDTRTALVICPLSTVGNWYNEFRQWCKDCDTRPKVHKLWDVTGERRFTALADWKRLGGVGILHYNAFRTLANSDAKKGKGRPKPRQLEIIRESLLDPGPDIVVCDEGHLLKNASSQQSKSVMKLKTQRRVVLTGTPLQNNLDEYHTMMSFVKPNLLGTIKEFRNRFVNPIANGQHKDSDDHDVKIMKRRAHVLHKLLDGCVQRLDYSVLTPYLPPKFEYAITINLSAKQKELYVHYLRNLSGNQQNGAFVASKLFADYQALVKIWTHPIVLSYKAQKEMRETSESEEGSIKDFICDDTSDEESNVTSDDDIVEVASDGSTMAKKSTRLNPGPNEEPVAVSANDLGDNWYATFFENKEEMGRMEISGKLIVLFEILKTCEAVGDKVLIFSQFLTSLDLIEEFLGEMDEVERKKAAVTDRTFPPTAASSVGRWRTNIEYFRIDGSTKTDDRQKQCDTFNNKKLSRAKLFLISTRAGGLGINLTGANRVIIFDASWNPSQDLQSIFRVFRFGQTKPCYVYRLLARGTMEEKIYHRQVVKLSLSCRVIDEQQIERHFQFDEIRDMYKFNEADETERPIPIVPKDRLLADLLISQKDWIFSYLEHDSLLENKEEEELSAEERRTAWEEYENEGRAARLPNGLQQNEPWLLATLPKLKILHPLRSEEELNDLCLQSKLEYMNLSQHYKEYTHPNTIDAKRTLALAEIQNSVKRLKLYFGDMIDWTAHLAEKRPEVMAMHQRELSQPQVQRQTQHQFQTAIARGQMLAQMRLAGQRAGPSVRAQYVYPRAPAGGVVGPSYPRPFSPTAQVAQMFRAAQAARIPGPKPKDKG